MPPDEAAAAMDDMAAYAQTLRRGAIPALPIARPQRASDAEIERCYSNLGRALAEYRRAQAGRHRVLVP